MSAARYDVSARSGGLGAANVAQAGFHGGAVPAVRVEENSATPTPRNPYPSGGGPVVRGPSPTTPRQSPHMTQHRSLRSGGARGRDSVGDVNGYVSVAAVDFVSSLTELQPGGVLPIAGVGSSVHGGVQLENSGRRRRGGGTGECYVALLQSSVLF